MTGQARVHITDHGTDIRVYCRPCGINQPSTWPAAREAARTHNAATHPRRT